MLGEAKKKSLLAVFVSNKKKCGVVPFLKDELSKLAKTFAPSKNRHKNDAYQAKQKENRESEQQQ